MPLHDGKDLVTLVNVVEELLERIEEIGAVNELIVEIDEVREALKKVKGKDK